MKNSSSSSSYHFLVNLAIFLLLLLPVNECGENVQKRRLKVLVYSGSFGWSHRQFMGKIADTLVEAGHEVHLLKFFTGPFEEQRNETKLAQKIHGVRFAEKDPINQMEMVREPFSGKHFTHLRAYDDKMEQMSILWIQRCQVLLESVDLIAQLEGERFDVAMAEMFDPCPFAFFHRIGANTKLGTFALPWIQQIGPAFGIPTFSSFVPSLCPVSINGPLMNFWERTVNFYNDLYDWAVWSRKVPEAEAKMIGSAFGAEFLPIGQHLRNVSLVFLNISPFLDFQRPVTNKLVYIGGIADANNGDGQLEKEVQQILDSSIHGAVLVSFGTLADTRKMSAEMRQAMLAAFAAFPEVDFIWKLDRQSRQKDLALFASVPNVHTFEWLQQGLILRHPKLLAFVSHCGQNSLVEAARAGVPLVAIPLFADQLYNSVLAKAKGMAVHVDVREMHHREGGRALLVNALETLLRSPSFRENARLVGRKLALSPFSARDQLIQWVEFAAEFPALNELNLPWDEQLHWFVYYSLDAIFVPAILLLLLALIIFWLTRKAIRGIVGTFQRKSKMEVNIAGKKMD